MKQTSWVEGFLWTVAVGWVLWVVFLTPLRMVSVGDSLLASLGLAVPVGLALACLVGVAVAAIYFVTQKARQERSVRLPCDYDRACELCLASLELFDSCE